MPNTLPVPSKAALRTLRRIALGTSCTVAFTTGLLTEDRRRRIRAAREVHNNAKLLKSSRKYHSGGNPSTESFEDQVMKYSDDGLWLVKESLGVQSAQTALSPKSSIPNATIPYRNSPPLKISRQESLLTANTSKHHYLRSIQPLPNSEPISEVFPGPALTSSYQLHKAVNKPQESAWTSASYRQRKLAEDVTNILGNAEQLSNTAAAVSRFVEAFEEGIQIGEAGPVQELVNAAAQLSKACQLDGNFPASERIIEILSSYGPLEENVFHSLGVEAIVRDLAVRFDDGISENTEKYIVGLQRAVALYLTQFKQQPGPSSDSWLKLGEILCVSTSRNKLFDLTEQVYWRMAKSSVETANSCFHHLIAALHKQGRHKDVIKRFRRLSRNARTDQSNFRVMGDQVIDSALQIQRLDLAEESLFRLVEMSKRTGVCSTTWFLKILGGDWRAYREIARTRALFHRLEPHLDAAVYPQAAYSAIIQFCIEAGDEAAALRYYDCRLEKATPTQVQSEAAAAGEIRVLGHFAYAKAMRSDWAGVQKDFREMRLLSHQTTDLNASFAPIFKLFAQSHSVNETEEYLRSFIDQGYVTLTSYMSTSMINKYGDAREIDSISRWLDYMISVHSPADPAFFNSLIYNCRTKWNFSFEETYQLFQKVREIGGAAARFVDRQTISILRNAAIAGSVKNISKTVQNLNRLRLDQPLTRPTGSESVQEHMAIALGKGHPRKALAIFDRARKGFIPLDGKCLPTVVQAALQINPDDIHGAASLLREPQKNGCDISAALAVIFVHQLSHHDSYLPGRATQALKLTRRTMSVLEERGVDVHPSVLTHTMSILVSQQQHYQAIDFWKSMLADQKTPAELDLPTLTVILQAYIGARDCKGVEWAVQMLSVNALLPDRRFKQHLKMALNKIEKARKSEGYGYEENNGRRFYHTLQIALARICAIRSEAVKDKQHVRAMTIEIMEKAIKVDNILESVKRENAYASSARTEVEKMPTHERLSDSCDWVSDEEPEYVNIIPRAKLLGAQAG